mmetsp:Transcript_111944/g.281752  ORF Transcript_111944/g.281752 Transcript_111944/m.281752 type:complete len:145 (+) Transcript_111944:968-1402(+)
MLCSSSSSSSIGSPSSNNAGTAGGASYNTSYSMVLPVAASNVIHHGGSSMGSRDTKGSSSIGYAVQAVLLAITVALVGFAGPAEARGGLSMKHLGKLSKANGSTSKMLKSSSRLAVVQKIRDSNCGDDQQQRRKCQEGSATGER